MADEQAPQQREKKGDTVTADEHRLGMRRVSALEQRVEALTFALGAVVPDGGLLLAALMTAPREGWPAVVDAYRIGQARKHRGAGI